MAIIFEKGRCYDAMGEKDSSGYYYGKCIQLNELAAHGLVDDRFKSRFHDYQIQRDNLEMHEEAERQHLWMLGSGLLALFVVCFSFYRYIDLRRQHADTLQQNREYVAMLETLRTQVVHPIIESSIAQHFHSLSAQDTHPTDAEWAQLYEEVNRQYPRLFPSIAEHYELTSHEQHVIALISIHCTPLQMSVLLVCTKSNISNLRRRLYKKITGNDGNGTDLDAFVNEYCS